MSKVRYVFLISLVLAATPAAAQQDEARALTYYPIPRAVYKALRVTDSLGVGTMNPDPSAVLDVVAQRQGFLPPRMTTDQRQAIQNPADGLVIYNTETGQLELFDGTGWRSGGSSGWVDDGTVVRLRTSTDAVGVGTNLPEAKLDVAGTLQVRSGSAVAFQGASYGTAGTSTPTWSLQAGRVLSDGLSFVLSGTIGQGLTDGEKLLLTDDGRLLVGNQPPAVLGDPSWRVNTTGAVWGAGFVDRDDPAFFVASGSVLNELQAEEVRDIDPPDPQRAPSCSSFGVYTGGTGLLTRLRVASTLVIGSPLAGAQQQVNVNGGLRLESSVVGRPVCNASVQGSLWVWLGGARVQDVVQVCARDAGGAYDWRTLAVQF